MTRHKQRKQRVRAAQQATGRRYTPLARELSSPVTHVQTELTLGALLTECTTLPPANHRGDCSCMDCFDPPAMFSSQLLGVDVPYGSVLKLAGLLAEDGLAVDLGVESVKPCNKAVVTCGPRRYGLSLADDSVTELCPEPACPHRQYEDTIPWCPEHIRACDRETLIWTARHWGHTRREHEDYDPERCGGGEGAGLLIRAAAARGWYTAVVDALLDAVFDNPDEIADTTFDEAVPMRLRHAIDREKLRLRQIADTEVRAVRSRAGTCAHCGARLFPLGVPGLTFRAEYCSAVCDEAVNGPSPESALPVVPVSHLAPW